jgi:predicted nucleic acid-binding protein
LKFVEGNRWQLLNSDAIFYEVNKIPDMERKTKVRFMLSKANEYIRIDEKIFKRAKQIQKFGVKSFDALHVACAEGGKADVFLTTDDQLLKKLHKHSDKIKVRVVNPLDWIKEVI